MLGLLDREPRRLPTTTEERGALASLRGAGLPLEFRFRPV